MKHTYFFSKGESEGNASLKELLGGKGANLAEMASLGIPVPPGFTLSTEVCRHYQQHEGQYPEALSSAVKQNLQKLEALTGMTFGDPSGPLLVSVRSGAAVSMPGMMDTVLNLGLNDETVEGLANKTGNERFAYDSYRRLIQMYGDVVLSIKPDGDSDANPFDKILEQKKEEKGVSLDTELDASDLREVVSSFKELISTYDKEFPQDPTQQLWGAITAVFESWDNPRAVKYRQLNKIEGLIGTAVNVQAMVFGNMGDGCGSGVAFTRNPATGENEFYGEYLTNAQGEDVVAGIRTPRPVNTLRDLVPSVFDELLEVRDTLEKHYRDMQDIEFTMQDGELYLLQTRTGKRTAHAAVRIAVEMANEGTISKDEAVQRVRPEQIDQLMHPMFDQEEEQCATKLTTGLPASPGAATGSVVFSADEAEKAAEDGKKVILVRIETSPEDISGMHAAEAILTTRGGMTSHAAVVARGMGKCCIAGAGEISIDYKAQSFTVNGNTIKVGDQISLNGSKGIVYEGKVPTVEPELSEDFGTLLSWADEKRTLGVRANADTPNDAEIAIKFGAEGVGLCRTEHMFFEENRIISVREMILADDEQGRRQALGKLLPMQTEDFIGLFTKMNGHPTTIRLLDPPLHEFLPHDEQGQRELAEVMGISIDELNKKVNSLHEFNPMLGHRGCRLAITYPEISEMQVQAIINAACIVHKDGVQVAPEIMIPLVGNVKELIIQRQLADKVVDESLSTHGLTKDDIPYKIGTMIEVPRAAVTADEIAEYADFFSFGTNDLTQMGCGFSRDDADKFLSGYVEKRIYSADPFQVLDQQGVGKLVQIACDLGRKTRPDIKLGICGEHGGEPSSIRFFHQLGLDYVSCSPYRVPIAKLAAAQAAIDSNTD